MLFGKRRLLDLLCRRYGKELVAFAGQRSGSDSAEDLVQEAYLRLLELQAPERIENHRAYLYRITSNLGADLFRREQVRNKYAPEEEGELEHIACPRANP